MSTQGAQFAPITRRFAQTTGVIAVRPVRHCAPRASGLIERLKWLRGADLSVSRYTTPFDLVVGDDRLGLVLMADHAGRSLPSEYGSLGLPAAEFERHIAYDIGAEALTRRLAELTGAPAALGNVSRLLIDLNRGEDDPTLIRQLYDGTVIAANYPLSAEERRKRLETYYQPYHEAASALIGQVETASRAAPFIFSVHSFTPVFGGRPRPWHVGILWDSDPRAPLPLIEMLKREPGLVVGDNEPYDGCLKGDSMYKHAIQLGYAHALVEVRQDLISDAAGVEEWAQRLAPMIMELNAMPELHVARRYGSRAD